MLPHSIVEQLRHGRVTGQDYFFEAVLKKRQ